MHNLFWCHLIWYITIIPLELLLLLLLCVFLFFFFFCFYWILLKLWSSFSNTEYISGISSELQALTIINKNSKQIITVIYFLAIIFYYYSSCITIMKRAKETDRLNIIFGKGNYWGEVAFNPIKYRFILWYVLVHPLL